MKKLILILSTLIVLAIIGAGTWAYYAYFYTKPLSQSELADLTPDWTKVTHGNWSPWITQPDGTQTWNPAGSFNAWVASIPEEDKAWPVLVDVNFGNQALWKNEGVGSSPQEPEEWALIMPILQQPEIQDSIKRLVEAFNRPYLGCGLYPSTDDYAHTAMLRYGIEDENWDPNPDPNPDIMNAFLPALGAHRNAVNLMCSSAMYQLEQGNADAFLEQLSAALRSADNQLEFPVLISQLVRTAIEAKVYRTLFWALEYHLAKFNDAQLSQLADEIGDKSDETYSWEAEALLGHDAFRRIADENGRYSLRGLSTFGTPGNQPTSVPDTAFSASFQRALWIYNTVLMPLENNSGLWPDDTSLASTSPDAFVEQQLESLDMRQAAFVELLVPSIGKAAAGHRMLIQENLAVQLTIAAHRHKLRRGEFPGSIDSIDSDLLIINPIDILSENQLGYRLTDSGPIIYSVGDDRIDNNGEPRWRYKDVSAYGESELLIRKYQWAELISAEQAAQILKDNPDSITGDWVFFPAPQDEPEPEQDDNP